MGLESIDQIGGTMRVGYIRVSTLEQNIERQLDGVEVEKTFIDYYSAKTTDRPELQKMLNFVREKDHVLVHSMDRLSRNIVDLRNIVKGLTDRGVKVEFVKENLIFTGDDSGLAVFTMNMMGSFAELERSMIRERQREGIEKAKARGAYKGTKKALNQEQIDLIRTKAGWGISKSNLAREFKVSRGSIYNALRP